MPENQPPPKGAREYKEGGKLKEFQERKQLALDQFIARHGENLPAVDFSEEEAVTFIPDELFMFSEIDSEDLEVRVNPDEDANQLSERNENAVVIEIAHKNETIIKIKMETSTDGIPSLYISSYVDCELIRGKEITHGFYDNLEQVAKALKFRTVSGQNHYENINYFTYKLGRYPLVTLKENYYIDDGQTPPPAESLVDNDFVDTVKFLYPEDKKKYVKPKYLEDDSWKRHCDFMCFPTMAEEETNAAHRGRTGYWL